jgi:hypothetical protein
LDGGGGARVRPDPLSGKQEDPLSIPWWLGIGALVLASGWGAGFALSRLRLAAGYKAKVLASAHFVGGRDPAPVEQADLAADDLRFLRRIRTRVDGRRGRVTAGLPGLPLARAVHRPGLGCALIPPPFRSRLPAAPAVLTGPRPAVPLPEARDAGLQAVAEAAFSEPDPQRLRRTRAVVVLRGGQIAAEAYTEGFGPEVPLCGWSVTKGALNALAGILVGRGQLALADDHLLAEWQADGRRRITVDHLLRMSSGLAFNEDPRSLSSDVVRMLFGTGDTAAYAAAKPLVAEPGTQWAYASGTSNILARVLREHLPGDWADYAAFPRRDLFDPLGMATAVLETDAAGTLAGSSFLYAGARDWARLGQLYLQDGVWAGERILPEGWVAYTRTPAPAAPDGRYGAHWWLAIPGLFRTEESPELPADAFHLVGHEGQFVTVVPSADLVVVRLGLTLRAGAWDHPVFVQSLLEAAA